MQPILRNVLAQFLRTLNERKDLRGQVRYIDIDAADTSCTCCLPYIQDQPKEEEMQTAKNICEENEIVLLADSLYADEIMETHMQIVLTILPNLTEIRLLYPRAWRFELLESWRYKGSAVEGSPRPFLLSLRRMLLEVDKREEDACQPGHESCDEFRSDHPVEDILTATAPNLELLACTASGLTYYPIFPHLTHLKVMMQGRWDVKMDSAMRNFPRLTHFSYWSVNEHCPPPREVLVVLLKHHRETLQSLSLSFSRPINDLPWGDEPWVPPSCDEFVIESFSGFTNLQSLTLDNNMIWAGANGFPVDSYNDRLLERDLTTFLPSSIETLFIENTVGAAPPLQSLAEAMASGMLKNLQLVVWSEDDTPFCIMDRRRSGTEGWLDDGNWREELELERPWCIQRSQNMMFPILTDFEKRYPQPPPDTPSRSHSPAPVEKVVTAVENVSPDEEVTTVRDMGPQVDVDAI